MTQQLLPKQAKAKARQALKAAPKALEHKTLLEPDALDFEADDEDADHRAPITELDISHLVTEDDIPVDNLQSAQQQRLLVDALSASKPIPLPFLAEANVGLFYKLKGDPIVPDVLLSMGVHRAEDWSQRENRSYFVWEFGKVPEVCIELVSNQEGDEVKLSPKSRRKGKKLSKKDIYTQIGVPFYVVFDPLKRIQGKGQMNGAMLRVWSITANGYTELTPRKGITDVGQSVWLESIGLGLTLWEGPFEEDIVRLWLRWCDRHGQVIPTGAEWANAEQQRADDEKQRADSEKQRADDEKQRADDEKQRADDEKQRADDEKQRADRLAERLRMMGIDPEQV
jgi:Uma2 family endonuclease